MCWSFTAAETCRSPDSRQRRSIVSAQAKPSIVFCHGLWADGSCFSKLITPLQAEGYETMVTDWRVTNLLASRFWPRRGFRASVLRLHRSIP